MVLKGIKFRIYPNKEQAALIDKTFVACRAINNRCLGIRKGLYDADKTKLSYNDTSSILTLLKRSEDYSFLNDVDSIALQQELRDQDRAFTNFFEGRARYPVFRSSREGHKSYRTVNQKDNIRFEGNKIKLPKLGYVKVKKSMDVGKIHSVTIEKTPTDKYFIAVLAEFTPLKKKNKGGETGIDVGVTYFYTDSNGRKVENPKYLEKKLRKLKREQRSLSRKEYGSKNYYKQKKKIDLIHETVFNQRNDFLQKESTKLVQENEVICIEDLKVKNMMKNKNLALPISSVSWSKFFTMLEYKAEWYQSKVIRVPTTYPSSQTCSVCGYKNPIVKNLSVRVWECPKCLTKHDRDLNASINILNKGLFIEYEKNKQNCTEGSPGTV